MFDKDGKLVIEFSPGYAVYEIVAGPRALNDVDLRLLSFDMWFSTEEEALAHVAQRLADSKDCAKLTILRIYG